METLKQIYVFLMNVDLKAAYANGQAIVLSILIFLGMLTIFCTVLAQVCKKVMDATANAELDGVLGWIVNKLNIVASVGSGILKIFPTWGTNPATQALKARLDELEAGNVNTEKANDNQGKPDA